MKNLIYFTLFTTLVTSLMACENPFRNEQLPPITQTGENTFGFKLDGEVWLPKVVGMHFSNRSELTANYHKDLQIFNIISNRYKNNEFDERFYLSLDSLFVINNNISNSYVNTLRISRTNGDIFNLNFRPNDGLINIIKLDTIK